MSEDPHAAAILARLRAVDGLRVFPDASGNPPEAATELPYVVAWIGVRYDLGPALVAASTRAVVTITTHSVGATDTAARVVAGRVRGALLDALPAVTGRTGWPIRHDDSPPLRTDESSGRRVYDQIDVYRWETLPG